MLFWCQPSIMSPKSMKKEVKKPQIILDCNRTKGAVDNIDKLVRTYSSIRKCRRWPMVVFGNLLDLAAYNAFVIFSLVHPEHETRKSHKQAPFLEKLALDLVREAVEARARPAAPSALPLSRIAPAVPLLPRKRQQCHICPRNADRKTAETCSKCNHPACKQHQVCICTNCFK